MRHRISLLIKLALRNHGVKLAIGIALIALGVATVAFEITPLALPRCVVHDTDQSQQGIVGVLVECLQNIGHRKFAAQVQQVLDAHQSFVATLVQSGNRGVLGLRTGPALVQVANDN